MDALATHVENSHALSEEELSKHTSEDPTLQTIMRHIQEGWPPGKHIQDKLVPYYHIRDSLFIWHNKTNRIRALVDAMLKAAHSGHSGMVKTKQVRRQYSWRPKYNVDAESYLHSCATADNSAKLKPVQRTATPFTTEP